MRIEEMFAFVQAVVKIYTQSVRELDEKKKELNERINRPMEISRTSKESRIGAVALPLLQSPTPILRKKPTLLYISNAKVRGCSWFCLNHRTRFVPLVETMGNDV
jgi:hypothetical protein